MPRGKGVDVPVEPDQPVVVVAQPQMQPQMEPLLKECITEGLHVMREACTGQQACHSQLQTEPTGHETVAEKYYTDFKRMPGIKVRYHIEWWLVFLHGKMKKSNELGQQIGSLYIHTDGKPINQLDIKKIVREVKFSEYKE